MTTTDRLLDAVRELHDQAHGDSPPLRLCRLEPCVQFTTPDKYGESTGLDRIHDGYTR